MNRVNRVTGLLFLLAVVATSASAQANTGKIGVIDTRDFLAEGGITKYIALERQLATEFQKDANDLQALQTKINTAKADIDKLQAQSANVPVANINQKAADYDKMVREFKYKQDDFRARVRERRQALVGPMQTKIREALQKFTVARGYAIIFDAGQMESAGLVIGFDRKYDATKDFIAYFNALP